MDNRFAHERNMKRFAPWNICLDQQDEINGRLIKPFIEAIRKKSVSRRGNATKTNEMIKINLAAKLNI